jgi:hypothetical protein
VAVWRRIPLDGEGELDMAAFGEKDIAFSTV